MRRLFRISPVPFLMLSVVSVITLGTYVLHRILCRTQRHEAGGKATGDDIIRPAAAEDDTVDAMSPDDTAAAETAQAEDENSDSGSEQPPSTVFFGPSSGCIAPLTVEVTGPFSYYFYLKLLDAPVDDAAAQSPMEDAPGGPDIGFFAAADSSVSLDVPVGVYQLSYALGDTWRGLRERFGPDTRYFKAAEFLSFFIEGNRLHGNTIRLFPPTGGASAYHEIDASEFLG